jgi:hypothetical protein
LGEDNTTELIILGLMNNIIGTKASGNPNQIWKTGADKSPENA